MIHYEMPTEVRKHVLKVQTELKIKKNNGKLSQQQALNHIVKEHKELTEKAAAKEK